MGSIIFYCLKVPQKVPIPQKVPQQNQQLIFYKIYWKRQLKKKLIVMNPQIEVIKSSLRGKEDLEKFRRELRQFGDVISDSNNSGIRKGLVCDDLSCLSLYSAI
jgi:hypothetical protein